MKNQDDAPYKLPNGCFIEVGRKVRVPKEHLNLIPLEDWEKYGLDIVEGEQSFASEVIQRTATASEQPLARLGSGVCAA